MSDKAWEKYGALGGIVFVVLAVVAGFLPGAFPSRGDSAEILEWYVDNDSAIQVASWLVAVGVIAFVWWFGSLWRAMGRADSGSPRLEVVALAGFVFSGAMAFGAFAVNAATAATIEDAAGAAVWAFGLASVFYGVGAIGNAVLVLAVSGLAMRSGFLPRWVALGGYVIAVGHVIASLGVANDADFFGVFGFIIFLVFAAWIIVVSVNLYQNAPTDT